MSVLLFYMDMFYWDMYWSFMNSLLKEEEVSFNFELSDIVLNESEPTIMAADYNFDAYVFPVYE
jgi:hypothetical protein